MAREKAERGESLSNTAYSMKKSDAGSKQGAKSDNNKSAKSSKEAKR
jgi:hypothetical protein